MGLTWLGEIRALGVVEVAKRLGLTVIDRNHLGPCPSCSASTRSRSDDRPGPLFLSHGGKGWTCGHCASAGGPVELASHHLIGARLEAKDPRWKALRALAVDALLCGKDAPKPEPPPPPIRSRVPPAEVAELWAASTPVTSDPEVKAWLERRQLDPGEVAWLGLCRALPAGPLPSWARIKGQPWSDGWRAVFRAYDERGRLASLRARWVHPQPPPEGTSKAGAAAGGVGSASGLVLADDFAQGVLEGTPPGTVRVRLVVVEGEPDWMQAVLSWPPGVLGVWNGSWTPEIGGRVPSGAEVALWTHLDEQGERYAARIARTLTSHRIVRRRE